MINNENMWKIFGIWVMTGRRIKCSKPKKRDENYSMQNKQLQQYTR